MTLALDLWLLVAVSAVSLPIALGRVPLLCTGVFVAIGGAGTLQLEDHGWPIFAAVAALTTASAITASLLVTSRRLTLASFALATWALDWLVQGLWLDLPRLAGGTGGLTGPAVQRLSLPSLGLAPRLTVTELAATAAVIALAAAAVNRQVSRGPVGLRLRAAQTAPDLVAALGGRIRDDRRLALGIAGAFACLAGAGMAITVNVISPTDAGPLLSLQLVLAALVTGSSAWWGPVVGTGLLIGLDHIANLFPATLDSSTASALVTAAAFALVLVVRRLPSVRRSSTEMPVTAVTAVMTAAGDNVATAGRTLLQLRDIDFSYGGVHAAHGVSLSVTSGRVLAVVGANGSGKTTMLRLATGALRPDRGTIEVDGSPLRSSSPADAVRGGVVRTLQGGGLVDGMSVAEHVGLGAAARGGQPLERLRQVAATPLNRRLAQHRAESARTALELTGLSSVAAKPIRSLDAGLRPLVAIAAAVATGARVLCLDEPAAGMDSTARQRLEPLLRNLAACGYGVVLVDHDLDLVQRVADDVVVFHAGELAFHAGNIVNRKRQDDRSPTAQHRVDSA